MRRDRRINPVSPGQELYHEREADRRRQLEASLSEGDWQQFTDPLVSLALGFISEEQRSGVSTPTNADQPQKESFEGLRERLLERKAFLSEDDFGYVLVLRVARVLAEELPPDIRLWIKAADLFRYCGNWASFVDSIPTANIIARAKELVSSPSSSAECFDDDFSESRGIPVIREAHIETEPLRLVWQRKRVADYCGLNTDCQFRSLVLERASHASWAQWLKGLPDAITQLVALNEIANLTFLESVLGELASHPASRPDDLLSLSVVWRTICLWEEIEDGLAQAVRQDFPRGKDQLDHWVDVELPQRVRRLVTLVGNSPAGLASALQLLRHLSVHRGQLNTKLRSRDLLRDELLRLFEQRGDTLDSTGLLEDPSKASLTAAACLALRHHDPSQLALVIDAYVAWLMMENHVWYQRFEAPDKELMGVLSAVLAKREDSVICAQRMIDIVKVSPQGWLFSYAVWLKNVSTLSHALVVIGMAAAAVATNEGRGAISSRLMKLAWDEFHAMLEHGFTEPRASGVQSPVAYIWACARTAFDGSEDEICRAIRILGDPTLVVVAAENLAGEVGLTSSVKAAIDAEADQLIDFYRHARNFSDEYAERLRAALRAIPLADPTAIHVRNGSE